MTKTIKKTRILVIEDDKITRKSLTINMRREGYEVIEASDAIKGIELFITEKPDIVLLDAMMPVMDGFECCEKLREISGEETTRILMITSLDDTGSVDRAFEVGAADYIKKPIHWPVLKQRIRRIIEQYHLYQELARANQKLLKLAMFDELTQVANRRHFDECLSWEWARMTINQRPVSLIFCDVDCFKLYNDTYGHPTGDACLTMVAKTIVSNVRMPGDVVARYGGEEFAVILPDTPHEIALDIAERIRQAVEQLRIPHIRSMIKKSVTISLGIACTIPDDGEDPVALINKADRALYDAKIKGRNRVSG